MAQRTIDLNDRTGLNIPQFEAIADGAVTPGMLVELQSTGKMKAMATASERCLTAFAVENSLFGKEVDTAYADGDRLFYKVFPRGARVYAFLDAGEQTSIGTKLVSSTGGALKAATSLTATSGDEEHIIAIANEAVDNTSMTIVARCEVIIV